MSSHDREFVQTVCNRVIELTPKGIIDKMTDYESYILDPLVREQQERMYVKTIK